MESEVGKERKPRYYLVQMRVVSFARIVVKANSRAEAIDNAHDAYVDDPEDTEFDWESLAPSFKILREETEEEYLA